MKTLFLIVIFFVIPRADAQQEEQNLNTAIARIGINDVYIAQSKRGWTIKSETNDDPVRNYIAKNPLFFRKELGLFSRVFHGSSEGYRLISHPSLHFIHYKRFDEWTVHFDIWCPQIKRPLTVAAHVGFEVIPHAIFGSRTSQKRIKKLLDRANQ